MKEAKEYASIALGTLDTTSSARQWNNLINLIEQAQLNAYRAGMTAAAKTEPQKYPRLIQGREMEMAFDEGCKEKAQAILSARDKKETI